MWALSRMAVAAMIAQQLGCYSCIMTLIPLTASVSGFVIPAVVSPRPGVGVPCQGFISLPALTTTSCSRRVPSSRRTTTAIAAATLDDGSGRGVQMFEQELPSMPRLPDQASIYNNDTVALSTQRLLSSYLSPVDPGMTSTASYGAVEVVDYDDSYTQEKLLQGQEQQQQRPLSAYLLLASAVIALASLAPLLNLQHDVESPLLKMTWRMAGSSMVLLPLALRDIYRDGGLGQSAPLSKTDMFNLVLAAASYCVWNLGFVVALDYTSVGDAAMFSNCQALVLLAAKVVMQGGISLSEGVGTMTALTGALLCSQDSASHVALAGTTGVGELGLSSTDGDLLAATSSLGGAGYLTFASSIRDKMSQWVFTFVIMTLGTVMMVFVQCCILNEPVSFNMDPHSGVLGFLSPDRLPLELTIVLFANILGVLGYVRSLKTFSTLTVSTVCLLEPIVAGLMGAGLGTGSLPGNLGWVGNALVAGGIFAVVSNEGDKTSTDVESP